MNNNEIKNKIIKLYKNGKEYKEIQELVIKDECTIEIFGGKYPKKCNENGYYCEECGINAIKNFLNENEV